MNWNPYWGPPPGYTPPPQWPPQQPPIYVVQSPPAANPIPRPPKGLRRMLGGGRKPPTLQDIEDALQAVKEFQRKRKEDDKLNEKPAEKKRASARDVFAIALLFVFATPLVGIGYFALLKFLVGLVK